MKFSMESVNKLDTIWVCFEKTAYRSNSRKFPKKNIDPKIKTNLGSMVQLTNDYRYIQQNNEPTVEPKNSAIRPRSRFSQSCIIDSKDIIGTSEDNSGATTHSSVTKTDMT